jgi:hypothetical protein
MKKRRENSPDYDSDFLQSYLDAFVQDSVALPAPIQNGLAKVISQAYAGGERGSGADVASLPFPTGLIKNPDIVPQTIGDAERLLVRSFYPSILQAAQVRSEGKLGVDPMELISTGVEKVMQAARTYDPTKGGFDNFAGNQIFGGVTGDARNATKPEQSAGGEDFWYNQLRSSVGENTVPTQFYTPGGAPLIGPNGTLNASAVIPAVDAGLASTYRPVSLTGADLDRYIAAKEGGLISGDPSVKRVESGLRRLNSNLLGGRGEGDNSFMGANSQEADALSSSLPEGRGDGEDVLDALFRRESTDVPDATTAARLRHDNGGKPVYGAYENDTELTGNRTIFKTGSMAQQADLSERSAAIATARTQLEAQAEIVPQVAYQTQQMQERLTLGNVRPGFAGRFKEDNPDLVPLSRRQYNEAQNRVREFERPEQVIPAQPLRKSDVRQSPAQPAEPVAPIEPSTSAQEIARLQARSDQGVSSPTETAYLQSLKNQAPVGPVSSSGGSGSDEPPEAPPMPMEEFPEPRRNSSKKPVSNRQSSVTVPPHGKKASEWFMERAGMDRIPTDGEAQTALNRLDDEVPAYGEMFQGQWAVPDPEFDKLYESMTPEQQKSWNVLMSNHHSKEKGGPWSPYKEASLGSPLSRERWNQSKLLQDGNISLEEFNAAYGTKDRNPVGYKPSRPTLPQSVREPVQEAPQESTESNAMEEWRQQARVLRPVQGGFVGSIVGAGDPEDVDGTYTPGARWDEARERIEARREANKREEVKFNPGNTITGTDTDDLKEMAKSLSFRSLGGARSSKLGEFTPRMDDKRNIVGGEYRLGSQVTASEDEVGMGLTWARESLAEAYGQGGLEGMSGLSAAATMGERVSKLINKKIEALEKSVKAEGGDTVAAKEVARRAQEVAKDAVEQHMDGFRAVGEYAGRPGDFGYSNAARLNKQELSQAAAKDSELREHLINSSGSVDQAAAGPAGVFAGEGRSYRYGDGAVWGGRGRGRYGTSGGDDGEGEEGPFEHSPYQSPVGRFMMAQFMMSMAWQNTGGKVLETADQYGTSQAYMSPMAAFGNGGVSGGAPGYAARMAIAQDRAGEAAYSQYGILGELGAEFAGGAYAGIGNTLAVSGGAGLAAGIGATALGGATAAAAGPIGVGVAALTAAPFIGGMTANAITGKDWDSGWSLRNVGRAAVLSAGFDFFGEDATNQSRFAQLAGAFAPWGAQGDVLTEAVESTGKSELEIMQSGWLGQVMEGVFPGALSSLAVSPAEQQAIPLSKFNREIASKYQIKPEESAKILSGMQVGMGGLDDIGQKRIAEQMVGISLDTNKDQLGLLSQYASLRGVPEGSEDWSDLALNWVNASSEEERVELLRKQTKMSQAYSQFAPYLDGGTRAAAQLADNFGLGHMASAQAFSQVASGFGMDYGRDMTDLEATGFAQTMQGQSPRINMKLANIANNVAGLGAGTMSDTFASLSGAVSRGVDANFLSEMFSGNLYAISDVGQLSGQGNLQYFQDDGQRMGTTDISGVLLGAQQRMGLPSSLTAGQTLRSMGLSFSSQGAESALVNGGMQGYEQFFNDQRWGQQMQSFGLQQSQMASNQSNMYATWGIQDQITSQQFGSQMGQFDYSLRRMDLQHQFQLENWAAQDEQRGAGIQNNRWQQAFGYETSLMQRDFTREGWNFQSQMSNLSHGWSMEDYDEGIRRSSGYERAQLIKRRDRETTSYNLNSQNTDNLRENQEELWEREDERYRKSLEYTEQMIAIEEENIERQRAQYEALYQMERENTVLRQDETVELHELQMQLQKEQRRHQEEQLEFSKRSLALQIDMAKSQHEYGENMRQFTQSREKDEAAMRKLIGYAPVFSRMVEDWVQMIEKLERSSINSLSDSFSVTR